MDEFWFNYELNLDFERTGAFYPRHRFKRVWAILRTVNAYLYDLGIRRS